MKFIIRVRPAILSFVVLVSLLTVGVALADSVIIDPFEGPNQTVEATGSNHTVDGFISDPSILGVERDIRVTRVSGNTARIQIGPDTNNELVFSLGNTSRGTALITYDGVDGNAALDPDGLCSSPPTGCVDFTGGGTNNSIHFETEFNNVPFQIEFRVYSGVASDYSFYQWTMPGSIALNGHVDFIVPFAAFSTVGSGADFTSVGAFELFLNGADSQGAKLNLDFIRADSWRDYGDAPSGYGTVTHTPNGLRLGINVDAEEGQLSSPNARGDDSDQAPPVDEDGVTRTSGVNWSTTGGGSVDTVLNGCIAPPCYLNGWVDWDQDGTFDPVDERIFSDEALPANGSHTLIFAIPGSVTFDTTFFARFRICSTAGECSSPIGIADNGEVEDHQWAFGPTAIVLNNFTAQSGSPLEYILILSIAAAVLLVGVSIFTRVKRHRRA